MADILVGNAAYVPTIPGDSVLIYKENIPVAKWLTEELSKVATAIASTEGSYPVRHVPPVRYYVGQVVYADGTDWNPGAGEGLYVYKSTGWTLIA